MKALKEVLLPLSAEVFCENEQFVQFIDELLKDYDGPESVLTAAFKLE